MTASFDDLFREPQRPEPGQQPVGALVGPYCIDHLIAETQFTAVYQGHDVELDRPVALKVLKSGPWLTHSVRQRFRREGRLLARLRHPHIVTLYGMHLFEDQPCLAFEFLPGGTLANLIRKERIDSGAAIRILTQISRGLAAAHRRQIVHRDLKPQNILFDPDGDDPDVTTGFGQVKVTEFGIARMFGGDEFPTLTGNAQPGTPAFMAPEQIESRKMEIGPPTDVHAFGVLMYLLLAGRHPFEGDYEPETLRRILTVRPAELIQVRPEIPRWLSDICARCLEKDPQDRFASASEIAQLLNEGTRETQPTVVAANSTFVQSDTDDFTPPPSVSSRMSTAGLIVAIVTLTLAVCWRLIFRG